MSFFFSFVFSMTEQFFQNSNSTGNRSRLPSMQIQKIMSLRLVIIACELREKISGENIEIFSRNHDFSILFDNLVILSGETGDVGGANVSRATPYTFHLPPKYGTAVVIFVATVVVVEAASVTSFVSCKTLCSGNEKETGGGSDVRSGGGVVRSGKGL